VILTTCVSCGIGFFRTPKDTATQGLLRALRDAREELLLLTALMTGSVAVPWREDGALPDRRLWAAMLMIQAVPYAAAGLVSMISAVLRLFKDGAHEKAVKRNSLGESGRKGLGAAFVFVSRLAGYRNHTPNDPSQSKVKSRRTRVLYGCQARTVYLMSLVSRIESWCRRNVHRVKESWK